MAKNHHFLATDADLELVHMWLAENGAKTLCVENPKDTSTNRTAAYVFPNAGGVSYWPERIQLSEYNEGSDKWKKALMNLEYCKHHPGVKVIDYDDSAVALLHEPCIKEEKAWVMAELAFPGSKLKEAFPVLNKINSAFGRWLKKNKLVYDWTGKEIYKPYPHNLIGVTNCIKVFALPHALELLRNGYPFVDRMVSKVKFDEQLALLERAS